MSLNVHPVELPRGDEHLEHIAGNGSHDVLALDLGSHHRCRGDDGPRWPGQQDLIVQAQRDVRTRVDIRSVAHDAFDTARRPMRVWTSQTVRPAAALTRYARAWNFL